MSRLLPLVSMASRSSSHPHSCDKSTLLIDDDIRTSFSKNLSIDALELRKEREEPQHEFIVLKMPNKEGTYYLMERRPSKGTSIESMWRGCKTDDTITRLERDHLQRIGEKTDWQILVDFPTNRKPDLFTVFTICDAIRKDPDADKYTLLEFNCYFFARTLTSLIIRHFLLRQYCRIHKSPRKDFGDFPGSVIDAIGDKAYNTLGYAFNRGIRIQLSDTGYNYLRRYRELREHMTDMNKNHCRMFGEPGDVIYDTLNKKKEEIWGRMHLNLASPESQVACDSHAMVQSDKDIKELLFASKDSSLWRFAREFDWTEEAVQPVVVKTETDPSYSQTKDTVAGKDRREEDHVNKDARIFWSLTVSEQYHVINAWVFLQLAAIPYPAGLGFTFIVAGVVLWVCLYGALVAKVLCTVLVVVFLYHLISFSTNLSGYLI